MMQRKPTGRAAFLAVLLSALAVAGFAAAAITATVAAAPSVRQTNSVHWLNDLSNVPGASAKLVRTDSGVSFSLRTSGLASGDAVTLWWVVFNNPEACTAPIPAIGSECGLPDLFDPATGPSVFFAAGHVIGKSGKGNYGGYIQEGATPKVFHPAFVGSPGVVDSMEAEIHLVVRTHGPMIPSLMPGQIQSFEVACDVNVCADLQAAAFTAVA